MSKKLSLIIICLTTLFLSNCNAQIKNQKGINMDTKNKLVVYFSATGTTKIVAEKLAGQLNADLFEIEPETKYSKKDLDWTDKQSRTTKECNDKAFRPKIKNLNIDIQKYDTIFIGYPIWWYTAPNIIKTFIESKDLSNKVLYLFATSGSSPIKSTEQDLKQTYPNLKWQSAKLLNTYDSTEINNWLK